LKVTNNGETHLADVELWNIDLNNYKQTVGRLAPTQSQMYFLEGRIDR
jgi:hypothetical protein